MRFYMLSDLHFGENKNVEIAKQKLGKLCADIRSNSFRDDIVLFVIMGDIINAGADVAFDEAGDCLNYIRCELSGQNVRFEFLPGNHDILEGDINQFDTFISKYQYRRHRFENGGAYSNVHDGVNFIFADSNTNRNHKEPGLLNLDDIRAEIKKDMQNVLFCHHSITQSFGGDHDTVKNGYWVKNELINMGISFVFHGHTHRAYISTDGINEIACGPYHKDVSDIDGIYNQFMVGYIRDGKIISADRWLYVSDGSGGFAFECLFPKPKRFADPNTIGKIKYKKPLEQYILRKVLPHSVAIGDIYERVFSDSAKLLLVEAIQKNDKILLLSDAGNGKTVELQNLAFSLYDTNINQFPFFYTLRNYNGEKVSELLPDQYRDLHSGHLVLILDGYDELTVDVRMAFEKQLRTYLAENEMVHILISARSNFCKAERNNKSSTLDGFYIYDLCELTYEDIVSHLTGRGIDCAGYFEELRAKGLTELKNNPFYLERLIKLYSHRKSLPLKSELMNCLIEETFEIDDKKYQGSIDELYAELFRILEKLSFAMQLMQKHIFNERQEYQKLFSDTERKLAKHSGLITRFGEGWQFVHNNFREFLAARYLSRLPSEKAISYFSSVDGIKPSWVNTLGYLTGLQIDWDLKGWLAEHAPEAIVKFEPDRIDTETKYQVLRRIFEKFEEKMLWFHDELCDERELAHFSCSELSLEFLLDKIKKPVHYISQYTAIQILRHFPNLYGKQAEVLDCLMGCCKRFPETSGEICRLAINAIYQLHLDNSQTTEELFRIFGKSDNDYIRLGMYEYLTATGEHDVYTSYFLEGIQYILFNLRKDLDRMGNEEFELVEGLKKMSTPQSICLTLEWFTSGNVSDFHSADEVFSTLCERAAEHYINGNTVFYGVVMRCLLRAAKEYHYNMQRSAISFFEKTGTLPKAAVDLTEAFAKKLNYLFEFFNLSPQSFRFIAQAYQENRLSNSEIFHEIVKSYIRDEQLYTEFADLIVKKDGVLLPEPKRIDYEDMRKCAKKQYFDMLFKREQANKMLYELLAYAKNPDLSVSEFCKTDIDFGLYSPLEKLKFAIGRYANPDSKIKNFFDNVCWSEFIVLESKMVLDRNKYIKLTSEQKEVLLRLIQEKIDGGIFKNAVRYEDESIIVSSLVRSVVFLILYLNYNFGIENMLDMTELPNFCFDRENRNKKLDFLETHISHEKLGRRIVENICSGKVNDMVLNDHFGYCKKCHIDAAADRAVKICVTQNGSSFLRDSALEYLYEVLGTEYICNEVLPYADWELLITISNVCKDIARDKLVNAMEEHYRITPAEALRSRLITFGRQSAVESYVRDVEEKYRTPEKNYHPDGPTQAIATIHDVKMLPLLGRLLDVIFDRDFIDTPFRGLKDSLLKALINCGKENPDVVIAEIEVHRDKMKTSESRIRVCNYVIEEIEQSRRINNDQPWLLDRVECLFGR